MSSPVDNKNKALKMMLWFGIGSLIMTFAGLTSAFIVSKNRVDWVNEFPNNFAIGRELKKNENSD